MEGKYTELEKILNKCSIDDLKEFVYQVCIKDGQLREKFKNQFTENFPEEDISLYCEQIKNELITCTRDTSSRFRGYYSYDEEHNFLEKLIKDTLKAVIRTKQYDDAKQMLETYCKTYYRVFENLIYGELLELNGCIEKYYDQLASSGHCDDLFKQFANNYLNIKVCTEKEYGTLTKSIESVMKKYEPEKFEKLVRMSLVKAEEWHLNKNDYTITTFIISQIILLAELCSSKDDKSEFEQILKDNISNTQVVQYYIYYYNDLGEYDRSLKILKECESKQETSAFKCDVYKMIIPVLQSLNLNDQLIEYCKKVVSESFNTEMEYFRIMKEACDETKWSNVRDDTLAQVLDSSNLAEYYANEQLIDELAAIVFNNKSYFDLFSKYVYLIKDNYPEESFNKLTKQIEELTSDPKRDVYEKIAGKLEIMAKCPGYKQSTIDYRDELATKFKRRPSFVSIINQLDLN